VLTLFNDAFFMCLMFLLSGLFVWPSLKRKASAICARPRLPARAALSVLIFILMPIAYYASFRLTGSKLDFVDFYLRTSNRASGSTVRAGSSGFCCFSTCWRSRYSISHPD